MKRFFLCITCLVLLVSLSGNHFASVNAAEKCNTLTIDEALEKFSTNNYYSLTQEEALISRTIEDPDVIAAIVRSGDLSPDTNGNLPLSVTVFEYYPAYRTSAYESVESISLGNELPAAISPVILDDPTLIPDLYISRSDQLDKVSNNYISYDQIAGPSTFSTTYTASSKAEWTTTMKGSVTVGGKVFSIADLKAEVSASLGTTIGTTVTISKAFTTTIPQDKICYIKTYLIYSGFNYTGYISSGNFVTTIGSGDAWTPCGLRIVQAFYDYDQSDFFP